MRAIFEDLPVGNQQSINAFSYAEPAFNTPWHFHPQHELTLIEESSGTKFIGDYVGAYSPGELVLLKGNLPHCWKNQQSPGLSRSTVIQWNPETFPKVPELEPVFVLLREAARGILFEAEEVRTLLPEIRNLPGLPPAEKYLRLLSVLQRLSGCRRVLLSAAGFTETLPRTAGNRMQRIHRFVEQNYQHKVQLSEAANQVHLSEQAFNRFFRKTMGRPFFTFLNEYRVNRASQLLVETDWPVAQIAQACGFASLPFFHRQFKRFMETTPLQYRKKH
ncbi:helix-turn-helix domain-containing protein [Neolewinella aurantiaca]|uniref:Helix-turn-helix domain-containing protein n=1 Tax=Neolewinella aurantiaca TaxID=2602767 RepID=A0A5C7FPR0_9BACT|nr:AraC family transcriptional regulator [Neolewinella aurantiaca]TXF87915.1 helix-turn-helix domain-containing protein [Neolewinella aurantiaca]